MIALVLSIVQYYLFTALLLTALRTFVRFVYVSIPHGNLTIFPIKDEPKAMMLWPLYLEETRTETVRAWKEWKNKKV